MLNIHRRYFDENHYQLNRFAELQSFKIFSENAEGILPVLV